MKRLILCISLFLISLTGICQEYFTIKGDDGFEYKYVRQKPNMRTQFLVRNGLTKEQFTVKSVSNQIESLHKDYKYDNGDLSILSPELKRAILTHIKEVFKIPKVYLYDNSLAGSEEEFQKITGYKGISSTLVVSELHNGSVLNYWFLTYSKNKTWISDFEKSQLNNNGYSAECYLLVESIGNYTSIYMFLK